MLLRAFFANVLADLQLTQATNEPRTKHKAEKHRRQAGVNRSNGNVAKNVKRAKVTLQNVVEQVVKHLVPYLLPRNLAGSGVTNQQRFDDAFHFHSARAFYQQHITWGDELFQKLCSFF